MQAAMRPTALHKQLKKPACLSARQAPRVLRCRPFSAARLSQQRLPTPQRLPAMRAAEPERTVVPEVLSDGNSTQAQRRPSRQNLYSPTLLGVTALAAGLLGTSFNVEGPGSVVQAMAVLAAVVTIHECGHFLAARLQGIHVKAFSVGFGPVIWSYQGEKVEYTLRALPLGGYVGFPEDDGGEEFAADDPDLLRNRGIASRALVISAGVIANVIFAYTILFGQVSTVGIAQARYLPGVLVPEITQFSPADKAGLRRNDLILAVQGVPLSASDGQVAKVVSSISASPSRPLDLTIERAGRLYTIPVVPEPSDSGSGRIGVQLSPNVDIKRTVAKSPTEAIALANKEFTRLGSSVTNGISRAFTNFASVADQLSGPVAIVAAGSEIARADPVGVYQFAAIVNINLAVVNVLPIPALDGWYLLLLAVEAVRGKKLPDKLEQGISASGLLLLLALGAVLVVRDTLNLLVPM